MTPIDTLRRVRAALPVLQTMLTKAGLLQGATIASEHLADLDAAIAALSAPEASGADAFADAMKGCQYGEGQTANARHWFMAGYNARINPAPPTSGKISPPDCRNRLMAEGKPYPRSGCVHCKLGGLTGCPYENRVHATPAGESGASAQEPEWLTALRKEVTLFAPMKSSFTLSRDELAHLFAHLQPSGAVEDAFNELIGAAIELRAYPNSSSTIHRADLAIAAARLARGEG